MSSPPSVRPFGDAAVLAELGDLDAAHRLAGLLGEGAGGAGAELDDVVVGLGTVTVLFDPRRLGLDSVLGSVRAVSARATTDLAPDSASPTSGDEAIDVPVCFDGEDLEELADSVRLPVTELVARITGAPLQVAFVGFSPGFAYMVGLPPVLAAVGRRRRPRPVVPAGSVAVGGGFAGIYPTAGPGGWHLVGRTGVTLFDPLLPGYSLLRPGCRVRLRRVELVPEPVPLERPPLRASGGRPAVVVEEPGLCTLVEDGGRRGVAGVGVPGAGAADPVSLRLANRLVGNAEDSAGLEVTVRGPRLRAGRDLHVAVVGRPGSPGAATLQLDGRPAPDAQVLPLSAGQVLEVGEVGAVRAVLSVSGGLATEPLFGSRSSDLLSGLGPGPLRAGDELGVAEASRPRAQLRFPAPPAPGRGTTLRVLPGPEQTPADLRWLSESIWRLSPDSNRIGSRFVRDSLRRSDDARSDGSSVPAEVPSRGMVRGALQLPPGGEPVVLGPDHATVGGYPVPAVVISADLHLMAHLAPGQSVRFEVVDHSAAAAALARLEAHVAEAVSGWFPTRVD